MKVILIMLKKNLMICICNLRLVSQTMDCVMKNSSNCLPSVVGEMKDLLKPGMLQANYNCSVLTQVYQAHTSCPIVGNCSIAMAMGKITDAIARSSTMTGSRCR